VLGLLAHSTALLGEESPALRAAREFRAQHGARILAEYAELVRLPNVASDLESIQANAEFLRAGLEQRGVNAQLLRQDGVPPIVFGSLEVPGADRTLAIYVHYDGQPVDENEWASPPFTPTLLTRSREAGGVERPLPELGEAIDPEWRLYGRSVSDDKAPLAALFAALDALQGAGIEPTSNLKFFFEGEEEGGSPHLETYLEHYGDLLEADLWLIFDGPVHQSRRPQLVFGVRGITGLDITVYGATRTLHSGHYGNWAPNPAMMLAQLLASMKDEEGRVLVPGFYDSTAPISPAERAALDTVPDIDDQLRREIGLAVSEAGNAPLLERLMLPSLNVRGLVSAAVGDKGRNIIPEQATASLDLRLVKGNRPQEMLDLVEAHIEAEGFHIVREEPDTETRLAHDRIALVNRRGGYPAARTSPDLPVVQGIRRAAEAAAGEPMILLPTMGGSLPLYLFDEVLGRPVVIVPIANHDNNQHAPDENLRLANLWYGIDLAAALLTME
jgi:acetylornithine deacetylase/succinyl-diaminopimelate desuccinylase-like protein